MKTYIEIYCNANGEKPSLISEKLGELGLKPTIGEHDFVYNWKEDAPLSEVLQFVDRVHSRLNGTGSILKFSTFR